ncbi:MAG: hypothetical protein FWE09_03575 [Treponema sp.]|nr:hypothetical protein [Treponema sp.]
MELAKIGGTEIFLDAAEKYAQINDIDARDFEAVWEGLRAQRAGYEAVFCFRDSPEPLEALTDIGAAVLEDCVKMRLLPKDFRNRDGGRAELLSKTDFANFSAVYDAQAQAEEMFWTGARILERWDIWRIFVLREGKKIIGFLTLMIDMRDASIGEIFCIFADNRVDMESLFSASATCAFDSGKREVIFMAELDDAHRMEAASAVGFEAVGHYRAYRALVPG